MSNVEVEPAEVTCTSTPGNVEILEPRDVPLGGPRAMSVRRTLPQKQRSFIGAWCFCDHYGPDDHKMDVAPHPHTGLQTVSWLFTGEIEHRDSHGVHAYVRPGELNLMTGGRGICHSEVSTTRSTTLHGVQLWLALPDASRDAPRDFQHYSPPAVHQGNATIKVFLGELAGEKSPVRTFTPLLGAEIVLEPNATVTLDIKTDFEHGVLLDTGDVKIDETALTPGQLGYIGTGRSTLTLSTTAGARVVVLGGTPFGEEIVMWWNFVGRTHDEIAAYRDEWQAETDRFGRVEGYPGNRLPAPPLPGGRLRPRGNPV
ncbi:pirin [Lentzea guizhouensis]|uniref:Pirin n=1 Tax=Lentzea guizhouensis TaxID=1586287 RepID=A0A1B2HQL8_9PSEU|nr:pirin family protein [Lentzea guizhouensis]ANZ39982.1 pirin [Lentzea guizhouensis]